MNKIKYILGFVFLAGCSSNPFVGKWSDNDGSEINLFIEENEQGSLSGSGHAYLCQEDPNAGEPGVHSQQCDLCSFDLDGKVTNDHDMVSTWSFHGYGVCKNFVVPGVMCSLSTNNEELTCQVPGDDLFSYHRDQ